MKRKGRPEKIKPSDLSLLRELALEQPLATRDELVKAFQIRTGVQVHSATLRKALATLGVVRVKPLRPPSTTTADQASKRYGYQDRHRPPESGKHYPSSLTDAEWNLVQDLFEREGERGVPAKIPRRALVDACCYVVRTGCAWRLLPKDFPH
ncbi:transposase [Methylomonas koyamae]|uniref:transposase n=1 Tax=Methylomonas koyamae TaxID=702114 RepID=UPI00112CA39A|nr:transposase [Methylomonas koyamae]TPQ24200.1 hypothetical protein C2U68_21000 [Methylomonas koyamae]